MKKLTKEEWNVLERTFPIDSSDWDGVETSTLKVMVQALKLKELVEKEEIDLRHKSYECHRAKKAKEEPFFDETLIHSNLYTIQRLLEENKK